MNHILRTATLAKGFRRTSAAERAQFKCCKTLSRKAGGGPCPYAPKVTDGTRWWCGWHVPEAAFFNNWNTPS